MWGSESIFDVPRTEVFKRYNEESYLDSNWKRVQGAPTVLTGITGDLQIYKTRPIGQADTPDGYTLQGAYRFSTKYTLRTMEQVGAVAADIMEKNGRVWYVWRQLAGGTGGPLITDEYNDYILLLQALPNEGSPL